MISSRLKGIATLCLIAMAILTWVVIMIVSIFSEAALGSRTIWEDAALKSPHKYRPHINLSTQYFRSGEYARALSEAQRAIEIDPKKASAYINATTCAVKLGAWKLAYKYSHEVLKRRPIRTTVQNHITICRIIDKNDEANRFEKNLSAYQDIDKWTLDED